MEENVPGAPCVSVLSETGKSFLSAPPPHPVSFLYLTLHLCPAERMHCCFLGEMQGAIPGESEAMQRGVLFGSLASCATRLRDAAPLWRSAALLPLSAG